MLEALQSVREVVLLGIEGLVTVMDNVPVSGFSESGRHTTDTSFHVPLSMGGPSTHPCAPVSSSEAFTVPFAHV
eukprot:COSAG01_NODE_8851_length_2637_cov_6.265957_3_plen_74_part_00